MRRPVTSPPLFAACILLPLLACRPQPSADIEAEIARSQPDAEPLAGKPVIAEAPTVAAAGPRLDWGSVSAELDEMVTGERYRVDYGPTHPWVGAAMPRVTIVVFSDYQCPFCVKLDETLRVILQDHPDTVRVVYRQFPLPMHQQARVAAAAALAAHEQGAFWAMHTWLFDNAHSLSRQTILDAATAMAIEPSRFSAQIDAALIDQAIEADIAFGREFRVTGTPAAFINGRPVSGAQPLDVVEAMVVEEERLAGEMIAAGSPPDEVWARIMLASEPERLDERARQAKIEADKRFDTQLAGLPRKGAAAKSTAIEILVCADFDCPYCKRSTATIDELLKKHSDIAVFFRHEPLPFHTNARAAHRAAVAADNQGEFWAMHDLLFAEPKQRSKAELEAMAKQIGLNMKRFRKDVAAKKTDELIDEQSAFCSNDLTARGTPTFFINGRKLVGAQPIDAFEAIIDEERAGKGPPPLPANANP